MFAIRQFFVAKEPLFVTVEQRREREPFVRLKSVVHRYTWKPGVNVAACGRPWIHQKGDPVPADYCFCGLHGVALEGIHAWLAKDAAAGIPLDRCVYGLVWLYGTLIVDDEGIVRGERGRILALAMPKLEEEKSRYYYAEVEPVLVDGEPWSIPVAQRESVAPLLMKQYGVPIAVTENWAGAVNYLIDKAGEYERSDRDYLCSVPESA